MRYGIRDVLLVISVLCGGLAISSFSFAADDPQPAPAIVPETSPAAEQPAPVPAVDAPAVDAPAVDEPQPEKAGPADKAQTEGADHAGKTGPKDAPADGGTPAGDHAAPGDHAGDDHTGDHDPYDLTHVNATPAIEDPSELKSDLAIWTFVVFLCLLALLAKFAWGPIMEGLERRETSIAAAIDEAEQAAAKGAEQLKLYEAKLAAAADETREILARARQAAEATGERIVTEAQEAAGRERDKAVADISAAKNSALAEITERSVDLAVSMAGRMIQRQLTPDDRAGLIREALDQLPNQN